MRPTQTFLWNQANAALLAEVDTSSAPPARPVGIVTRMGLLIGALFVPGVIVAFGAWLVADTIRRQPDARTLTGAIVYALVCCGIGLALGLGPWFGVLRHFRLLRSGRVIRGEVVSYSEVVSSGYTEPYAGGGGEPWSQVKMRLEYAFVSPASGRVSGVVVRDTPGTAAEAPPQAGDPLAVLYLDDENYQLL